MIPDSGHFTGLTPANIWKLAMLGRYAVNPIASSNIRVVQVAIVFNRPGPALSLDVSKIRTLLFARGNHHEALPEGNQDAPLGSIHSVKVYPRGVTIRLQTGYNGIAKKESHVTGILRTGEVLQQRASWFLRHSSAAA